MFNKPNVFGRNEPIARRDSQPIPAYGAQHAKPSSDKGALPESPPSGQAPSGQAASSQAELPTSGSSAVASVPSRESSSADNVMGARLIVGPDVKLRGAEILDCDTLVVEGRVEATMDSRVIRIAEKGSFAGKVSIDIAEIHGTFEGELTARSQLIIHSTGRVSGTIRYGKLVADEGGELCGEINVISAKGGPQGRPVPEPIVTLSTAAG